MEFLPIVFFGTLFITLFILIIINLNKNIIMPSINEEKSIIYIDDNNVKYRYYRKKLD